MDTIEKALQKLGQTGIKPSSYNAGNRKNTLERLGETHISTGVSGTTVSKKPNFTDVGSGTSTLGENSGNSVTSRERKRYGLSKHGAASHFIRIDLEQVRQAGLVIPDEKRSRIKEEYRHIKRPLLMNASGKGATLVEFPNLLMVTSSQPGEGKTFNATNLAMSIAAERDSTVLLVDADVVRPSLSKFFGLSSRPGLVDYLVDDTLDIADVLVETDIPSLTLLPAGNTHHLSTELLASRNMRELARDMSLNYPERIVIFDSPPLLSTTEASVLATLVGQIIMVVEAHKTRQSQVKEALALLDPDMIVGFVLNKARQSIGSDYYYGYGYYGDSGLG